MNRHWKKLRSAGWSIALTALASGALAFDGQKPATSPAPTVKAETRAVVGGGAKGVANEPNANPALPGGVQANQIAGDESTLDKIMFVAIESSDPEAARQALLAGLNLRQDFKYGCESQDFSSNNLAEEKFFNIASPDAKNKPSMLPGRCSKQHFAHAFAVAGKLYSAASDPRNAATIVDAELLVRSKHRSGAQRSEEIQLWRTLAASQARAFEVLALIDANVPVADKAFYPSYIATTLMDANISPLMTRWVMDRYFEALPEIKRARGLREPSRVAWDSFKAKGVAAIGGEPAVFNAPYEAAFFDPAILPGGDDSLPLKSVAVRILYSIQASRVYLGFARDKICKLQARGAGDAERLELKKKYLANRSDSYTLAGLDAAPLSGLLAEIDRLGAAGGDIDNYLTILHAARHYQERRLVAYLLSKPETIEGLNNKQTQPGGSQPPLNFVALRPDPAMLRAMLNAGVSPSLRNKEGKTAFDMVMGPAPKDVWAAQAFLKKDFNDPGCEP